MLQNLPYYSTKKLLIAIQTYNRANILQTQTGVYRYILPKTNVKLYLKDIDLDLKSYKNKGYNTETVITYNYLSELRQYIINQAYLNGYTYLILSDDDLILDYRKLDDLTHFLPLVDEQEKVEVLIDKMVKLCTPQTPITHPLIRQFSQDKYKHYYSYNNKAIRFVCYHVPTLAKLKLHEDDILRQIINMSDYYIQLKCITNGHKSISLNYYVVGDSGTGRPGGCSTYRTPANQTHSAKTLQTLYPNYIKLRPKNNGNWKEPRLDVLIHWKKTLNGNPKHVTQEDLKKYGIC